MTVKIRHALSIALWACAVVPLSTAGCDTQPKHRIVVTVTDKAGWTASKSVRVKVVKRKAKRS